MYYYLHKKGKSHLTSLMCAIFFFFATSSAIAQVTVDIVTIFDGSVSGSTSWSHTCSGAYRLLVVSLKTAADNVTGVTYNSVALTSAGGATSGSGTRSEIWYLVNPSTGANSIVVSVSATTGTVACGISFNNVAPGVPLGTLASATGSDGAPSVNVSSAVNDMVVDAVSNNIWDLTVGAGQTPRQNVTLGSIVGGTSTESGAASVTMSWSHFFNLGSAWAIVGVSVKDLASSPCGVGGTVAINTDGVCTGSGNTVELSLSGELGTIQWQQQINGGGYSDLGGATSNPFTTAALTGGNTYDYRAKLTFNSCTDTSDTVSIFVGTSENFTFTSQSVSLSEDIGCQLSNYTFSQTIDSDCKHVILVDSIFTITFPAGTNASTFTGGTFNGTSIVSYTIVSSTQIDITTPVGVSEGSSFTVVLNDITNADNISANASTSVTNQSSGTNSGSSYTVTTSACPTPTNYTFTGLSITLCNDLDCGRSRYTFTQSTTVNLWDKILVGETFTITFPAGTNANTWRSGTYDGTAINMGTATKSTTTITFVTPVEIDSNQTFTIVLEGITNGVGVSGNATTSVPNLSGGTTSASTYAFSTTACPAASNFTFTSSPSVSLSDNRGCSAETYTFTQSLTADKGSQIDSGVTVTVDFLAGTNATTATSGTFNGVAINTGTWTLAATQITFVTPVEVACPSTSFTIVLNNITNPESASGNGSVSVANITGGTDSYTLYSYSTTACSCFGATSFFDLTDAEYGCCGPSYATANANGWCLNDLAAGRYCFNYTYPSTNQRIKISFLINNCFSCSSPNQNQANSCGGGCEASTPGCGFALYDLNCDSITNKSQVGSGCLGGTHMVCGNVYTFCIDVPAGCAGAMDICPMIFCEFDDCSAGSGPPLPIELLYFDAKPNDEVVDLTWATASEINNDYFTVEKSTNAADFDIIVKVPGAGTSTHTLYYSEVDRDPYYGISYYRLKQTDYDGQYEYSDLVAVSFLRKLNFSVRPNPATDYLEITFGKVSKNVIFVMTPEYDAEIKIFNAQGELVYKKEFNGTFYKFNIDISSFSEGMYFVSLTANNELYKAKFVKE